MYSRQPPLVVWSLTASADIGYNVFGNLGGKGARMGDKGKRKPNRKGDRVMVFVDYENIRLSLAEYFVERVTPAQLVGAFRKVAEERGVHRGSVFFGDWGRRPTDARQIEENGAIARLAISKRSGKDRSDTAMMLDLYDAIKEKEDITAFVVGAGDADYKEVIRRGRDNEKRMYVCAVTEATSRELLSLCNGFIAVESVLGLTPKAEPQTLPGIQLGLPAEEWRPFILALDSLESKLPYVVRNYLRDSIMDAGMGCGHTKEEKGAFLDRALEEGITLEDKIPNPKLSGRTVQKVSLNRSNDIVKRILRGS